MSPAARFILRLPTGQIFSFYIPPATRCQTRNLQQIAQLTITRSDDRPFKTSDIPAEYHPLIKQWFQSVHNEARELYPEANLASGNCPVFATKIVKPPKKRASKNKTRNIHPAPAHPRIDTDAV